MPGQLVILNRQFEAYVTVLAGEGDGPLITIDHNGHIHIGPDPRPVDREIAGEVREAAAQITQGVHDFTAALGRMHAGAAVN
jgi:hypothetical protein